jgi:hypothetical protein
MARIWPYIVDVIGAPTSLALMLLSGSVLAGQISGSAHDFSTESWAGGQICIACHAPHHTDTTTTDAPLWNHAVTTASYSLYSSATLDASVGQPGGLSKLCLSCHDGTVAVNSFGGVTGSEVVSGQDNLGVSLNDDHPIGFIYNSSLATQDGSLHDPSSIQTTIGSGGQLKTGTIAEVMLFNDRLECSSCHDVHNTFTADGGDMLVRVSQSGSAMCLVCHDK